MSDITDIFEQLNEDLIYHGWLAQHVASNAADDKPLQVRVKDLLTGLLSSGEIEIGNVTDDIPNYLEFVAWVGTVDERVARAMEAVETASGDNKLFAYWLCLRKNVDRFEDTGTTNP